MGESSVKTSLKRLYISWEQKGKETLQNCEAEDEINEDSAKTNMVAPEGGTVWCVLEAASRQPMYTLKAY